MEVTGKVGSSHLVHIHVHNRCGSWRNRIRHIFVGIHNSFSERGKHGFCVIWNTFNDQEGTGENIGLRSGCWMAWVQPLFNAVLTADIAN